MSSDFKSVRRQREHLHEPVSQQAGNDGDEAVAQEHSDAERVAQPVGLVPALRTVTKARFRMMDKRQGLRM